MGNIENSREAPAHVALLQRVLGSVEEVGPVCGPDPLVLGGFVLLLVGQLKTEQRRLRRVELIATVMISNDPRTLVMFW